MAAKSTKKKKSTGGRQKKSAEGSVLREEILILATLAVCILLVISNFGLGGIAGGAVSSIMFGLFGLMAYALPFILFGVAAFLISNKGSTHAYIKAAAAFLFILLLTAFFELVMKPYESGAGLLSYYKYSSQYRNAGGFMGGCIVKLLCPLIGKAGTYVVIVILSIICVILITEKSLLTPLSRRSKAAYADARKKSEELTQKRAGRQLEKENKKIARQARRQDNKVSGVSFATTLTQRKSPDLVELTPPVDEVQPENIPSPFEELVINRAEPIQDGVEEIVPEEAEVKAAESSRKTRAKENTNAIAEETAFVEESIKSQSEQPIRAYQIPPMSLLNRGKKTGGDSDAQLRATALKLEHTLQNFGVQVHVTNASCGPSVTRYEIQPEQGVKVSRIVGLADDIKLNLAVTDLRIEAPIPGKAAVGIEVPNSENTAVMLRDLLEAGEFKNSKSGISFAVGKDISGKVVVADIAKMPHLLVAGATGSGKSVCINTLIMSILYKASPEDVKLIMVDPKVVELSVYNGIPHLLIPVVTDPKKAAGALNWAVAEMEKRYKLFAEYNVRDLKGFNEKISRMKTEEDAPKKMPQIVIIVDELADLMMVAPGEVEGAICRLAQLARAAGLHLILATQRPSVNVITGLIKANMPSRIAFSVSSGVDSRTIIDMNGAEKLLGKGDMLFYPTGYPKPVRVQGSFVSDKEVQQVVDYLIQHNGNASYSEEVEEHVSANMGGGSGMSQEASAEADSRDAYFVEAGQLIIDKDKASIGMLQRMFKIGFNRAARIMDQLAQSGVVGPEEGTKPRKVLMSKEEFEQYIEENV
ncbi:MAG: DNA translocase FtsK [Muricomes sp.]